jgi:hypothetical protein
VFFLMLSEAKVCQDGRADEPRRRHTAVSTPGR